MRVEGYCALHYGRSYVSYAIKSVYDHVDRFHVVYTPTPSHGQRTGAVCPETKEQLLAQVLAYDPQDKIRWHEVDNFKWEGQHRDYALSLCQGDLALVVDYDEVWEGDVLDQALRMAWDGVERNWLINFTTLWRSFDWCCRDNMWPVRIIDKRRKDGTAYVDKELGDIHHFGYCVTDKILEYKMSCHGHKGEWRPNWWTEKWEPWPPVKDVHPTCLDTWFPTPYQRDRLPKLLRQHPFYGIEKVE